MLSYPFNAAGGLCAGAAQVAALCSLVIRGAQRGLTKAVSRTAAAEHALSTTLNAVGGRVLLRKTRARSRAFGTRGGSGPLHGEGSPDGRRRPRTPIGVRASAVSSELPFLRDTWRLRTHPQAGNGPGPLAWCGNCLARGTRLLRLPTQLQITTQVLPCCSKSGYPCYRVPT